MSKLTTGVLHSLEKSLYRNQFILGPCFIDEFPSWRKTKVRNSICLTTHPDLNVYQATHENKSITLIGYILDPDNSGAQDKDIINALMGEISRFDKLLERSGRFSGRWILVIDDGKLLRLFHDAAGQRQVFYTDADFASDLWCASQPGMIAERLQLEMDPSAVSFINSFKQINREYWWPGDSSPYKEVRHLLPNYYLSLDTGQASRYWPTSPLTKLPLEEAIGRTAKTLQGLMESASRRYDLAVDLTAGWDSRLVLAASRGISDKVTYLTVKQRGMSDDHPDIAVPSLLLSKLGLKHVILDAAPTTMDDDFLKIFNKNAPFAHEVWAPDALACMNYYSDGKLAVSGSVSGIAKCGLRGLVHEQITPQSLSSVMVRNDLFVIRSLEKWLKGLNDAFNYNILDLFGWEQRYGNWQAMASLEFDIALKDVFTPFNCRELLVNMLAVDEKYRKSPKYKFYNEVILLLWPDLLSVPINPHKKKSGSALLKSFLRTQLRRYGPDFLKKAIIKGSNA